MKNIKLDSILLFALVIPFIMTYRLSPGDTPYWWFGLIFLGLLTYMVLDLGWVSLKESVFSLYKNILLWVLIVGVIGSALFSAIIVRHQTSPIYNVHDIILQQEAAVRFFLHGTNPYSATYFNTPLKDWHYSDTEINPALYHFVMEPVYLVLPVPFYLVMGHGLGFFDARVPLFALFLVMLFVAYKIVTDPDRKRQFLTILAFNPATLGYFLEGRDDVFMYAFLLAGFYLLYQKKFVWGMVAAALAFATKQSVWPIFPFLFTYIYFQKKNIKQTLYAFIPFLITFAIATLPFFAWNPSAFLQSTVFYLSGNDPHSYPIAGYGFGSLLHQIGFIKDVHLYYPFWIWQAIFCLPLLFWLIIWQKKSNSMQRLIIVYGIFLFVFWYLSRYFNNSHLGYLSMIFITAYFWPEETTKGKGV